MLPVEGVTGTRVGRETDGDICCWIRDGVIIGSPRLAGTFRFLSML